MGCPLNSTWAQSSAQWGGPGQPHAAGWEERCSSSYILLVGEGLVQLPILQTCLWLSLLCLYILSSAPVALCLPCCLSSFIASCLWDMPRALVAVLFILSVPTSAQKGAAKAGFTAHNPAWLLLDQEVLLPGSSSFWKSPPSLLPLMFCITPHTVRSGPALGT